MGGKGGRGGQKMYIFVHAQVIKTVHTGGGQKWQNSVHVVVECPQKWKQEGTYVVEKCQKMQT